ncbi:hypothetical protein F4778DRAFT_780678 [Xylariomycetidae sp. FL2044]|nr:hypothetical protein F4778DRAFT_780678 [Xylariomycetidae sp. FL2044]
MSKEAKEGGDLSQWAKDGTSVPNDAGKQNVLPSVPNPHQKYEDSSGGLGATSLNTAADNPAGYGAADDNAISATGHPVPTTMTEKYSKAGGKERPPSKGGK